MRLDPEAQVAVGIAGPHHSVAAAAVALAPEARPFVTLRTWKGAAGLHVGRAGGQHVDGERGADEHRGGEQKNDKGQTSGQSGQFDKNRSEPTSR